jgi:hypothetical protein
MAKNSSFPLIEQFEKELQQHAGSLFCVKKQKLLCDFAVGFYDFGKSGQTAAE